jgi:hypothetical protein
VPADENFLSRWSRRKTQAKSPAREEPASAVPPVVAGAGPAAPAQAGRAPLPPVESLTPESDFAPFMSPEVDGDVRRQALKTLFGDPRFNTMDMMDVYVDDYSKPDPLPPSWLDKMETLSRLGDRAGRDREEAERKALAEAEAAARAAEPPPDPAPRVDSVPSPDQEPENTATVPFIPATKVGDSGT